MQDGGDGTIAALMDASSSPSKGILDGLHAMCRMEWSYKTEQYMRVEGNSSGTSQNGLELSRWRQAMGEWAFHLLDHYGYPRETLGVCMNLFDRYMYSVLGGVPASAPLKEEFQLLFTTCLYLGLKVACPRSLLSPESMSVMCGHQFSKEQIMATEVEIIDKLQGQLRPPTGHAFLGYFAHLMPSESGKDWAKIVAEAQFSVEMSLLDCLLATKKQSLIALAALLNALEDIQGRELVGAEELLGSHVLKGFEDRETMRWCRLRLRIIHCRCISGSFPCPRRLVAQCA